MAVLTNVQCFATHPFEIQANLPSLAFLEPQLWGFLSVFRVSGRFLSWSLVWLLCSGWSWCCCAPGSALAQRSLNSNPDLFRGLVNWSCNFIFFIIVVSLKGCAATTGESWEDPVTVTVACVHPVFVFIFNSYFRDIKQWKCRTWVNICVSWWSEFIILCCALNIQSISSFFCP